LLNEHENKHNLLKDCIWKKLIFLNKLWE